MRCHEWAWGWDTLGINHVLLVPSYQSDPNQNATLYLTQKRVVGRWCPNCWPAKPLTFFYARCGEQFHHHTFVGLLADAFVPGWFFWGGWRRWPENETAQVNKWWLEVESCELIFRICFNHRWNWSAHVTAVKLELFIGRQGSIQQASSVSGSSKRGKMERCEDGTWKT